MTSSAMLVGDDGLVPKERYTSAAFRDLEMERLWPRVWQIACREEELGAVGDFVEYTVGGESILLVRTAPQAIEGFFNACLHRGTRLANGHGRFEGGTFRCPYHGWCYGLDGRLRAVPDRDEFSSLPSDLRLTPVRVECWGGFVFVNMSA